MTKIECLACLVNPTHRCVNCSRELCSDCVRDINTWTDRVEHNRCPDRPFYGSGNGHYILRR